jgi:8-oxo-dGTP pyrophosphatase MutT (NUDIX family)
MDELSDHGIVALVQNEQGKLLMLEDAREAMEGCWAPPHGRCESHDLSEEDVIVREVYEETGLRVVPLKKLWTQPADTKIKTVSFWTVSGRTSPISLNDESSAYGWFYIDEALSINLYPGTRHFLEMVKSQVISL